MSNRGILDRFFPVKYDFFLLLSRQAELNSLVVGALSDWLEKGGDGKALLEKYRAETDNVRMELEKNLVAAFSTPFERGDIYLLSVDMNKVNDYTMSTYLSMTDFGVPSDPAIKRMVAQLKDGVDLFREAVADLSKRPAHAEERIPGMRSSHAEIEQIYRDAMAALFAGGDPMHALVLREVYHHIKDASANLNYSVDTLHRIIVELT